MIDQLPNETVHVMAVKADPAPVIGAVWTLRYLCRHRYAADGTHLSGSTRHAEMFNGIRIGYVQSPSNTFLRTCLSRNVL